VLSRSTSIHWSDDRNSHHRVLTSRVLGGLLSAQPSRIWVVASWFKKWAQYPPLGQIGDWRAKRRRYYMV
jgi:hypothetical protein